MIHPTPVTAEELQQAIAQEIELALRASYTGYFRRTNGRCFVSPEGQMSWCDQMGRQVVVTVQVSQLDSDQERN